MTSTLNREDAAIELDTFVREIKALCGRLDTYVGKLRPEWRDKFNAITELHELDGGAVDKMKRLADEIYATVECGAAP